MILEAIDLLPRQALQLADGALGQGLCAPQPEPQKEPPAKNTRDDRWPMGSPPSMRRRLWPATGGEPLNRKSALPRSLRSLWLFSYFFRLHLVFGHGDGYGPFLRGFLLNFLCRGF